MGGQNRCDQPRKDQHLDRAWRSAHDEVDGKNRQETEAAKKSWGHEGAMTRAGERIIPSRRMHQRIDVIANRLEKTHVSQRTPETTDALPSKMVSDRVRRRLSER